MPNARNWVASSLLAIAIVHTLPSVDAREDSGAVVQFNLPAQSLTSTLLAIGQLSGQQIIFPGDGMAGLSAPAIEGRLAVGAALARALAGTGFRVEVGSEAIYIRAPRPTIGEKDERGDSAIVVTGSRIRGAASASPVYRYETAKLRDQGVTDMRGLAAAIPQNFTGGQSPAIGNGAESTGSINSDSSTAINLRGLGPGSTLTLLNGHRLAYNLSNQSVDFSSIPLAAVDRVEIMPDGASALYGSDAIGGVANIILKSDLHGITANAVVGSATSDGYVTQNYNLVGGAQWHGGGLMLTGNYDRNTDILAGDRSFTASNNPYLTLYPDMKSYAFVGSAHQEVTSDLRLGLDALYSHRNASRGAPYTATNPVEVSGLVASTSSWNYSIAPSAMLRLSNWDFSLSGVYGRSHLTSLSRRYPGSPSSVDLENETLATEFAGEGRLFALPAGDIRMALGGGYRRDEFMSGPMTKPIRGSQDNIFGYAELSIPLTSPKQAMAGFYRMALTTALRYEDYPGMGRLATPKFGAIWSPTADIDFKLSWGRSFKAPTLYQRLNPTVVYLFPGNLYGERQGAPAGQTILGLYGGKSDLKPEKADSLSATAALHPKFAPGLELAATYFRVNYRDRVVAPVSSLNRVLIDPVFADLVTFSPSAALIASTIATAPAGLDDQSGYGKPFDPTSVFAIIDGRSQNVARDKVNGMDVSLRYRFDAGDAGVFTLDGSGTYIKSSRILIAGTPTFDLAGTIFNPPHFKFRGGVGWSREKLLINAVVNFIGGVSDNRRVELADVDGMTSFDLAIKYRLGSAAHGLDVQVSALNLLDAKPDVIRGTGANTSFDSTNYSAIGRYLSLSLTKNF